MSFSSMIDWTDGWQEVCSEVEDLAGSDSVLVDGCEDYANKSIKSGPIL
jgi:hypothetical protein